jgi:hypothetical protein
VYGNGPASSVTSRVNLICVQGNFAGGLDYCLAKRWQDAADSKTWGSCNYDYYLLDLEAFSVLGMLVLTR